jgi:uncharacterized membrane protein YjgN (DUF898 family)
MTKERQLAFVVAGAVVIVALARYQPRIGGWVLLAIVLALLFVAERAGVFESLSTIARGG